MVDVSGDVKFVDEFHDESGTDEAEGSNDVYCATSDFYQNGTPAAVSAGFSTTAITEPDTSTTGTNTSIGSGTMGTYTVPGGMTSAEIKVWGAGGTDYGGAGGGGFAEGTLAVTEGQTLKVLAGEGRSERINLSKDTSCRNIVIMNSAAGIIAAGKANAFQEAAEIAKDSIDSGNANKKLEELVKISQELS